MSAPSEGRRGADAADTAAAGASARPARPGRPWFAIALIGGILGTVVVVHGVALVAYTGSTGDIEREDYYEAGEAFDGELALRKGAANGSFEVRCGLDGACEVIGRGAMKAREDKAVLVMRRADDATRDVRLPLDLQGPGRWSTKADSLLAGWWRARVELGEPATAAWKGRVRVGERP